MNAMYGGTKSEMERLLQDASKISGQKYDISSLSDVYNAIHVVQKEMKLTGTSAEEAKTTLSGSFNAMKAAASNFMGNLALGQNVTSSMKGLVTTTTTWLFGNLIPALGRVFQALPSVMGTFIHQCVPSLLNNLQDVMTSLASATKGYGGLLKNSFSNLLDLSGMISEKAGGFIKSGMQIILNIVKGAVQAIPTLIAAAPRIISNLANSINGSAPSILATGAKIIVTLAKGLIMAVPALIANIPAIVQAIFNVWSAFNWMNLGKTIITKIGSGLASFGETLALKGMYAMDALKAAVGRGGAAVATGVKTAFSKIGNFIASPFRTAIGVVRGLVARIKAAVNFASLAGTVRGAFNRVKTAITSPIQSVLAPLRSVIKKIKGFFPLSLGKIMSLKLPHISANGGKPPYGIGGKGQKPSFSVSWFAKGGIVDGATLIGAGEAGPEGIVPLNPFWERLDSTLEAMSANSGQASGGNLNLVINLDGTTIAQRTVRYINDQTIMLGTSPLNV